MKICITGLPGSGKSLAISYIKEAGYNTFVADEYVHEIYKRGNIGYATILKYFGKQYVNSKEVDRKKLGQLVFSDPKSLELLNKVIHPIIKKQINLLDKKTLWFVELSIYIYYPKTFRKCFDKILLINADKNMQKNNLKNKFSYLKKILTFFVGNLKTSQFVNINNINIDKASKNIHKKNSSFVVDNYKNKITFKKNILFFVQNYFKKLRY